MLFMVYKTLLAFAYLLTAPALLQGSYEQESGLGWGLQDTNKNCWMIWTVRENFIRHSLSNCAVTWLWVREMGKKEHSQGHFQSGGEVWGIREGSCPSSRVCSTPCDQSRKQGAGPQRSKGPFSACYPQSWSLSIRLFLSLRL